MNDGRWPSARARFGPYELLERLGSGGTAEIYRARQHGAGGFCKEVALKRVREDLAHDAEVVQMLLDEAKLAVRMAHGNMVQVLNLVQYNHQWALVLEYVDGVDLFHLGRVLAQHDRRLDLPEILHICDRLLEAVDFLHRLRGEGNESLDLIHSDIAPANVMISVTGEVKLIDFGITRSESVSMSDHWQGGKLRYLAPEHLTQDSVGQSADLYALGIVLWEMVAGERIYEDLGPEEILSCIGHGHIPRLSELRPDIPAGLQRVVDQALARHPQQRFADAAAFQDALQRVPVLRRPAQSRRILAEIAAAAKDTLLHESPAEEELVELSELAEHQELSLEEALSSALET